MTRVPKSSSGFTIVELLIVIVVIAILAAITIVGYTGIRQQSEQSAAKSTVSQMYKKVETHRLQNSAYPADLAAVGFVASGGAVYDFRTYPYGFCVSTTQNGQTYHVSTDNTSPTDGTCGQIKAEYFNNTSFSGTPAVTRYEEIINNVWGGASPGAGINADNFTARYTSYLVPPVTGTYSFWTNMDDQERVTVNGVVLGDYLAGGGSCCVTRLMPVTADLTAGVAVPVTVELREGGGSAYIRLYWAYPGQTQTIVPTSAYVRLP